MKAIYEPRKPLSDAPSVDLFDWEIFYGFRVEPDGDGVEGPFEHREKVTAVVECPHCGIDVDLWADTDAWTEDDEGRWRHESYGPAMGECPGCGQFMADWFEGAFAIGVPDPNTEPTPEVIDMGTRPWVELRH